MSEPQAPPEKMCACGRPLHYTSPVIRELVEALVERMGEHSVVTTVEGSWEVPRHYVALHGLKGRKLSQIAKRYGWRRISSN